MKLRSLTRAAVSGSAALAVALGTVALAAAPAQAATDIKITAYPLTISGATQYGVDAGIFAKNGLNATVVVLPGAPPALQQLAGGQVQFAYVPISNAIQAYANSGMDLRIVAPADGPSRNDAARAIKDPKFAAVAAPEAICVGANSGITRYKDLAGKTIGINARQGFAELSVRQAIRKDGGDPSSINWVVLGSPQTVASVKNGVVAAGYVSQPFTAQCQAEGLKTLTSPALKYRPNGGPVMSWVTTAPYAQANPAVVKAFQKSIYEITAASRNKAVMDQILVSSTKLSKLPIETVRAGKPSYYYQTLTKADVQEYVSSMVAEGFIPKPINVAGILATQYRP